MRKTALLLLATTCVTVALAGELAALAFVESSGKHAAVGDGGKARGAYQFHKGTWDEVSKRRAKAGLPTWDWQQATNAAAADDYATYALNDIRLALSKSLKRPVTPTDVYAVWNLGFRGYQRRGYDITQCPAITRRAAKKFEDRAILAFSAK